MSTVGIVGGGQLARMLALAGVPLGLRFVFLDPAPAACAASLGKHLCAAYDDPQQLAELARVADVVTYEFENVPDASINFLARHVDVFPSARALAIARDRLAEKALFQQLGIATPPFAAVNSQADLERAVKTIGLPAVLKTRTLGYDGKGQRVLRQASDVVNAWQSLGGVPLVLEGFVNFQREISGIGVRSRTGETAFYPLAENVHRDGILQLSRSRPADPFTALAHQYVEKLLDELEYVGVLALELFQAGDQLLANEMAPRVHNSGHWTIEGAVTSQFENHLRAVLGLPLGSTAANGLAAMVNFIGELPVAADILAVSGAHLHLYGKEPRPDRKIGHATVCAPSERELAPGLEALLQLVEPNAAALKASKR
jgi:5-(carboxyamino)imidazole ribonucleotide synthase